MDTVLLICLNSIKTYHMRSLLVVECGDEAAILPHQVFHLSLLFCREPNQYHTQVLKNLQFVLGLEKRENKTSLI